MAKEKFEFQAETKQLLDLMIHSIYTNHEIFLRELVSNASDAIDKLHFASLTNTELLENDTDFNIRLSPDKDKHTLTISDNGIGMTKDEVVQDIGTIAQSGTKAFLTKLQEARDKAKEEAREAEKEGKQLQNTDKDLIGQFGVGFYSAFMVADKVTIETRKAGTAEATRWESTGDGTYTVEPCEKTTHGTTITLELGKDFYGLTAEKDLTDTYVLQELIKKYSDYIRYPIRMNVTTEETPKDKDGKPVEGAEKIKHTEDKVLNSQTPLWKRNKSELKPEDYNEFFKHQFHEWEDPFTYYHTKAEGLVEYTALLYIPAHAPFNLYYQDYEPGVQLYSRSVFIMDKCKDLLPDYLRFVKGLVDSPDFSLNISRELLQQSKQLKVIGKNLENNILKSLTAMLAEDRTKFESFWKEYGKAVKMGIYNSIYDPAGERIKKLADLVLFTTSKEGKLATLKEYVSRMHEGQKEIYYASGKDLNAIEHLPQMEMIKEKGLEVLCLLDPIDEFAIEALREYDGKKFQSLSRGDLKLDDVESEEVKKENENLAKDNENLLKDMKEVLGDKVSEVKLSNRLKSSAVCLVAGEGGPSLAMEQVFARADAPMFKAQRVLELNPHHALFAKLQSLHGAGKEAPDFKDFCELLYDQSLLLEGMNPDNPAKFAELLAKLMTK